MENKEISAESNSELIFILNKDTPEEILKDLINISKISLSSNNHIEEFNNKNNLFSSKMLQSLPNKEYFSNMQIQVQINHLYSFKITNATFFEKLNSSYYKKYYKNNKNYYVELFAGNKLKNQFNNICNLEYAKIKNEKEYDLSLDLNYDTDINIKDILYNDKIKQIEYNHSDLKQIINDYTELQFVGYKVTFKIEMFLYNLDITKNETLNFDNFINFLIVYMHSYVDFSLYEKLYKNYFIYKILPNKLYIGYVIFDKYDKNDYNILYSKNKNKYYITYGINHVNQHYEISNNISAVECSIIFIGYLFGIIDFELFLQMVSIIFIIEMSVDIIYFVKSKINKKRYKINEN